MSTTRPHRHRVGAQEGDAIISGPQFVIVPPRGLIRKWVINDMWNMREMFSIHEDCQQAEQIARYAFGALDGQELLQLHARCQGERL